MRGAREPRKYSIIRGSKRSKAKRRSEHFTWKRLENSLDSKSMSSKPMKAPSLSNSPSSRMVRSSPMDRTGMHAMNDRLYVVVVVCFPFDVVTLYW